MASLVYFALTLTGFIYIKGELVLISSLLLFKGGTKEMAKYDNTKFYWLQLKEDFFEDDAIQWLEEQKPNGKDYAYFYLKLCLKSLKSNGVLIRKVGNILIPYDNKKLAELTRMDFDTVTVAMELLKKIGLVKILENGEIYIEQLQNLIGSKSVGAFKKQQQRLLSGQGVDKCPPKIDIELEIDIEKDIDIEKEEDADEEGETIYTPYEKILELYHKICVSFPKVRSLSDNRKRTLRARYKENDCNIEVFEELFTKAENSDFLKGKTTKWKADFDWLINQANMIKVLEDKYKNEVNTNGTVKGSDGSEFAEFS